MWDAGTTSAGFTLCATMLSLLVGFGAIHISDRATLVLAWESLGLCLFPAVSRTLLETPHGTVSFIYREYTSTTDYQ